MRRLKLLYGSVVTGCVVLTAACSDVAAELVPVVEPDSQPDSVEILFDLPCRYAFSGGSGTTRAYTEDFTTRAEGDVKLRYFVKDAAGNWPDSTFLSPGETVWLSYQQILKEGTATTAEVLGTEVTKPYVVHGSGALSSLYACGTRDSTDANNQTWVLPNSEVSAVPLYLPLGKYKFRVMAPALPILKEVGEKNYCSLIQNGVYFCSSDERYENTKGVPKEVTKDASGVLHIELNPMVWQVASMKFTIVRRSRDLSLDIMQAGIEVSGLQRPLTEGNVNTYYNWRSGTDTIPMKRGDKYEWVRISGDECTVTGDSIIEGDVGVLPTNAMSTTIVILFNLTVNGVPTQYETTVNKKILEHGHRYHMKVEIGLSGGISVLTWQNQSWTTQVKFVKRR